MLAKVHIIYYIWGLGIVFFDFSDKNFGRLIKNVTFASAKVKEL